MVPGVGLESDLLVEEVQRYLLSADVQDIFLSKQT